MMRVSKNKEEDWLVLQRVLAVPSPLRPHLPWVPGPLALPPGSWRTQVDLLSVSGIMIERLAVLTTCTIIW
jgi:hypothetical protein